MKRVWPYLIGVVALLCVGEGVVRYFIAGQLDCLDPSPDHELLYELKPGSYDSDGWLVRMPEVHIEIASDRCRRMPNHPEPAGAQATVLFLGDSMTFGLGVDDADTFPALVENILRAHGAPDTTIANCGVPGYNLSQLVRTAELRLPQFKPRVLVLMIHSSDLESPIDFSALSPKSEATRFAISHSRLIRYGYIMARIQLLARDIDASSRYLSADGIDDHLRRLEIAARENNAQLAVVQISAIDHPVVFNDALLAHGLPAYLLQPLPRDERYFLPDREHWTVTGQRIVADQVASIVQEALARVAAGGVDKGVSPTESPG